MLQSSGLSAACISVRGDKKGPRNGPVWRSHCLLRGSVTVRQMAWRISSSQAAVLDLAVIHQIPHFSPEWVF